MSIGSLVAIPELQAEGPARLEAQQPGYLVIRFLASGAEMTAEARSVVRYVLMPGTRIRYQDDDGAEYDGVTADAAPIGDEGLLRYPLVEPDTAVPEAAIVLVHEPGGPDARLRQLAFHELRPRFARAGTRLEPEPWGPSTLCAREDLMAWRDGAWRSSGGVVALPGARVEPLPHQLLTARRVLGDRQVRFLLADEVGLGKTIEAGLVLQSLLALRPQLRVLVIAPGALISQWFVELFVRFGGRRFLMVDAERLAEHGAGLWEEPFLIVSSRAVESLAGKDALRFAATRWDMVIVDECHRMEPGGLLYRRIAQLSKATPHVLLLSATPERQHAQAYLALLHLLQPDAYPLDDVAGFERKLGLEERVGACIAATVAADDESAVAAAIAQWRALAEHDSGLEDLLASWSADGDPAARDAVIAYVREHYVLDHRVIRHRRAVLARLAESTGVGKLHLASRSLEWIDYQPDPAEAKARAALAAYRRCLMQGHGDAVPPRLAHWLLQCELACQAHPRLFERLLAMRRAVCAEPDEFEEYRARAAVGDLGQLLRGDLSDAERTSELTVSAACNVDPERESEALAELHAAAADWAEQGRTARCSALLAALQTFWREHPQEKVLVFTAHPLSVLPTVEALADEIDDEVLGFGAHQEADEREEAARRFAADDRCTVLVTDPLGGEGRNFQFVSVVVHLDLPWSLAAVEQRIGRVDRIGRDGDVPSWVLRPQDDDAVDAAWAGVLDAAVAAFTASSSGLEFVAREVEIRALHAALLGGGTALREALPQLVELVATERATLDRDLEDCFVDSESSYRDACRAVEAINDASVPVGPFLRWLRGMGGDARREDDPPRPWRLRPRSATERIEGVFDRDAALRHPQLAFFALGQELVDDVLDDAGNAAWCCASAWRRKPTGKLRKWEGLRVVLELRHDLAPLMVAGLPLEAMRRVLSQVPPQRLLRFVRSDGDIETDESALAVLRPGFDPRRGDQCVSPRTSRETWMRPLMAGKVEQVHDWQRGVDRGLEAIESERAAVQQELREQASGRLRDELQAQVAALRARHQVACEHLGDEHPDSRRLAIELEQAGSEAEALQATVDGATLRVATAAYLVVA